MLRLTFDQPTGKYVLQATERLARDVFMQFVQMAKDAEFRFDKEGRYWYSRNKEHAVKFLKYAEPASLKASLQDISSDKQRMIALSSAAHSDIEIPVPKGINPVTHKPYEYRDTQKPAIEYAIQLKWAGFCDVVGAGKQQSVDSLVCTPYGWRRIGDMTPSMYVIGSDGKPTQVLGVFPQGVKPSYRVTFSDGSSVEAGPEHLWTVQYQKGGKSLTDLVLTTEQLRLRPTIPQTHANHASTWLDLSRTKLYLPMLSQPVEYAEQDAPEIPPYLLGTMIANGYLTGTSVVVTFGTSDATELMSIAGKGHFSSVRSYGSTTHAGVSNTIGIIRKLGLDVASGQKFIPPSYLTASALDRVDLLHGLMDCDGSISQTRNRIRYHTTSRRLADDVVQLVEGLGGIASVIELDRTHDDKGMEYSVRMRLPKWLAPFRLTRKLTRFNPGRHALPRRTVVSVEYVRDVESVCIAVEAADQLYATEHCILTHNTVMTAAYINKLPEIKTVLCVVPASLLIMWHRKLSEWLVRKFSIGIVNGKEFPDTDIVIISWNMLEKWHDEIRARQWDLVVGDEIHNAKSRNAQRTKEFFGYKARKIEDTVPPIPGNRWLFLSGTAMPNRPIELFPLIQFTKALGANSNITWYSKRYCNAHHNGYGWDMNGAGNLEELQEILRSAEFGFGFVSRPASVIMPELEAVHEEMIEVPANGYKALVDRENALYDAKSAALEEIRAQAEMARLLGTEDDFRAVAKKLRDKIQVAFSEMSAVRHETGLAKIPHAIAYAKDQLESRQKVVIFAHHHDVIDAVMKGLKEYAPVKYDGDMSTKQKQAVEDKFQTDPTCRVLVAGITIAVGYTVTAANYGLVVEPDWVPGKMTQAIGRMQRIGQENKVTIEYLVLEDSLDARMAQRRIQKEDNIGKLFDVTKLLPEADYSLPENAVTTSIAKQQLAEDAKKLTPAEVEKIHQQLKYLAGFDADHAMYLNDAGFNRMDTYIGNSLAQSRTLSTAQAALGQKILIKYKRQLEGMT